MRARYHILDILSKSIDESCFLIEKNLLFTLRLVNVEEIASREKTIVTKMRTKIPTPKIRECMTTAPYE